MTIPDVPKLTPEQEKRLAMWPACKGACDQGRCPCPAPEDCTIDTTLTRDGLILMLGLILGSWLMVALVGIAIVWML